MSSNICKVLGEKVKKLRKNKGYSQEKFAELLEIGITSLSLIETGKGFVSAATLEKISKTLNIPVSELFQTNEENNEELYRRIQARLKDIKNNADKLQLVNDFLKLI